MTIRLTHSPEALPGSCYVCGSGSRDFYIDFNTDIEFHGAFYLCSECIKHIGRLAGYLSPQESKTILQNKEVLERENSELREKVSNMESAIASLSSAGYDIGISPDTDSTLFASPFGKEPSGAAESLGPGEGATSESSDDEDVAGLHSTEPEPDFKLDL